VLQNSIGRARLHVSAAITHCRHVRRPRNPVGRRSWLHVPQRICANLWRCGFGKKTKLFGGNSDATGNFEEQLRLPRCEVERRVRFELKFHFPFFSDFDFAGETSVCCTSCSLCDGTISKGRPPQAIAPSRPGAQPGLLLRERHAPSFLRGVGGRSKSPQGFFPTIGITPRTSSRTLVFSSSERSSSFLCRSKSCF
jgi:hypothetical protein